MIRAASPNRVQLMTAYRLHFERANLEAVEIARSGRIGSRGCSTRSSRMQVARRDNIRSRRETGGGPVWDLGVYCINAARYLFRAEPIEVTASHRGSDDPRFGEVEEMAGAVLRFPGDRLATFTCSFGAADVSVSDRRHQGRSAGRAGLRVREPLRHRADASAAGARKQTFPKRDQFAPELLYFSRCILRGRRARAVRLRGTGRRARDPRDLPLGRDGPRGRAPAIREARSPADRAGDPCPARREARSVPRAPARRLKDSIG